ncbi:MAG: peptidylprolyl isomerase [Candidatus Aminicenantes bacterium]|nr:peptidylprolyl isomerase [Candidatus Aminicenantes bacterium]
MRTTLVFVFALASAASFAAAAENPRFVIKTEVGEITVETFADKAPATAANFLKYVEAKLYDGTVFHRTVTLASPRNRPIQIEVIQGGQVAGDKAFSPVPLERTNATGVKHVDGAISMARSGPDTATSSFFICIGEQPELDFGGKRNADGQGFAAFGRVVDGADVVRKIHQSPANEQELLTPPVKIISISRLGP